MLRLRILSWSLDPGEARWQDLAAALTGWEWDVAALRGLPSRWPLPLTKSLDAEFRYAPTGGGNRGVRRLLSWGAAPLFGSAGGSVDAVLARRDRVVAEWPPDARRATRAGVHVARLACGIWVGNRRGEEPLDGLEADLAAVIGDEPLVLGGAGPVEPGPAPASGRSLRRVAHGGADGIWVTDGVRPVSEAETLVGGGLRGRPAVAITVEPREG